MLQQQTWNHFAKKNDTSSSAYLGFTVPGVKLSLGAPTQLVRGSIK